jgi:NAD(P)-dependent dehydrogenase (short-subunit alcohol dehydrogenase family)
MKLADRVAVVTGAGSGIGKAIARAFTEEGAQVCVFDMNGETAEDVAQQLGAAAFAFVGDAADEQAVDGAVAATVDKLGRLDIWVNNAGIILQRPVVETSVEEWDRILHNNLTSCFLGTRAAARQMIEQGRGGAIVNISSIHATLSEPSAGAYTAAKGGMEAFSRTAATELCPHKIRVNCIQPGATYTELTIPMYTEPVVEALYQRVPMREIAQPEWIASGAVFLASDDSRYMTGQVLVLDGGYVMDGSLPGAAYWEE